MKFPAAAWREGKSAEATSARFLSRLGSPLIRRLPPFWLAVAALSLLIARRPAAAQPYIYVSNAGSNSLIVVDMKTNNQVANVPNIGAYPAQSAFAGDGKLYIANQGSPRTASPCSIPERTRWSV